jgi:GNAT superfamily N-acetyltransferase
VIRIGTVADLPAIVAVESGADTIGWLGETGLAWHQRTMADPDTEYLVSAGPDGELAGFAVLAGLRSRDVELRRIVVAAALRGAGLGRALAAAAIERAYQRHGAADLA